MLMLYLQALAMNLHDAKQWIALFQDGRTSFNEGKGYTFDSNVYTRWCTETFGTTKTIPTGPTTSATDGLPELDTITCKVELDSTRETTELETNISPPPFPPRSPEDLVEIEDTGGPIELPANATSDSSKTSVDKSVTSLSKSPSTFRNRLSKLKLSRRAHSPSLRAKPAELEGR